MYFKTHMINKTSKASAVSLKLQRENINFMSHFGVMCLCLRGITVIDNIYLIHLIPSFVYAIVKLNLTSNRRKKS